MSQTLSTEDDSSGSKPFDSLHLHATAATAALDDVCAALAQDQPQQARDLLQRQLTRDDPSDDTALRYLPVIDHLAHDRPMEAALGLYLDDDLDRTAVALWSAVARHWHRNDQLWLATWARTQCGDDTESKPTPTELASALGRDLADVDREMSAKVEAEIRRHVQQHPDDLHQAGLAQFLDNNVDAEQAIASLEAAIEKDKRSPRSWCVLLRILQDKDSSDLARRTQHALDAVNDDAILLTLVGEMRIAAHDYAAARPPLERAIALEPRRAALQRALFEVLHALEDWDAIGRLARKLPHAGHLDVRPVVEDLAQEESWSNACALVELCMHTSPDVEPQLLHPKQTLDVLKLLADGHVRDAYFLLADVIEDDLEIQTAVMHSCARWFAEQRNHVLAAEAWWIGENDTEAAIAWKQAGVQDAETRARKMDHEHEAYWRERTLNNPQDALAWENLLEHEADAEPERILEVATRALSLDPHRIAARTAAIRAMTDQSTFDKARTLVEETPEAQRSNQDYQLAIAELDEAQDPASEAAMVNYQHLLEQNPADEDALDGFVRICRERKETALFEKVLRKTARTLADRGDGEGAVRIVGLLNPDDPGVRAKQLFDAAAATVKPTAPRKDVSPSWGTIAVVTGSAALFVLARVLGWF